MASRQLKLVGMLALLLFALLASYWYWSPIMAMRSMRAAVVAGDADSFSSFVDYPRVRESIKRQLTDSAAAKSGDNGVAASIGNALVAALGGAVVDAMVRPATLMTAMQAGKLTLPFVAQRSRSPDASASDAGGPSTSPSTDELPGNPRVESRRDGLNKLIVEVTPQASTKVLRLTLERSGFANWKLTDVRLPSEV